jgi:hypothetical protein
MRSIFILYTYKIFISWDFYEKTNKVRFEPHVKRVYIRYEASNLPSYNVDLQYQILSNLAKWFLRRNMLAERDTDITS